MELVRPVYKPRIILIEQALTILSIVVSIAAIIILSIIGGLFNVRNLLLSNPPSGQTRISIFAQ